MNTQTKNELFFQSAPEDEILQEQLRYIPAHQVQKNDEIWSFVGSTMSRGRVTKVIPDGENVIFELFRDKNTEGRAKYIKTALVPTFIKNKMKIVKCPDDYSYEEAVRKFLFAHPDIRYTIQDVYLNVRSMLPDGLATLQRTQRCLYKLYNQGHLGKIQFPGNKKPTVYFAKSELAIGDVVWHSKEGLKENEKVGIITKLSYNTVTEELIPTIRWYTSNSTSTTPHVKKVTDPYIIQDALDWKQYFVDQQPPDGMVYVPLKLRLSVYKELRDVHATGEQKKDYHRRFNNKVLIEIGLLVGILELGNEAHYHNPRPYETDNRAMVIHSPYKQLILDYLDKYYPRWRKMNRKSRVKKD